MFGFQSSFLLVLFSAVSATNQWVWKCNSNGFCTRFPFENNGYPTVEVCRLICGKFSALWPRPTNISKLSQDLLEFKPSLINYEIKAEGQAYDYLQDNVNYFHNLLENVIDCQSNRKVTVEITVGSENLDLNWSTDESYNLNIVSKNDLRVNIMAKTVFGARHALETFLQLTAAYEEAGSVCLVTLREAVIQDYPIYPHRGLLLDTARNFLSIPMIKKHINAMATSKLNVLHWHVTDSQSFPLELPRLPNMAKFGAYSKRKIYHPNEVKELISYAKMRGVRIVIEIDGPSHVGNGWQWGPDAGLGDLVVCNNQQPWRSFCIQPPCGQLNPANPNIYTVLRDLYSDILEWLPKDEIFHMGGDEVFIPCWNSSEEILGYLRGKPRTFETFLDLWGEYQAKILEVFDNVAGSKTTPIILWTSHLTNVSYIQKYLPKDRYIIQTWVPSSDLLPENLVKLGYKIIVSTKDSWYLDHGFWGSTQYHNWRNVYNNRIPLKGILGGEVCMWGEYVDDTAVESRTWPRAAAAAERLWSNPDTKADLAEVRFYRHRERLVSRGMNAEALAPKWCYQNEGECN